MLKNGTDLYTFAKLMGHGWIIELLRYLLQTYKDTEEAYRLAGPVDITEFLGSRKKEFVHNYFVISKSYE